MNRTLMLGAGHERLNAVPGFEHRIAMKPQGLMHKASHGRFVFHKKNRLTAMHGLGVWRPRQPLRALLDERKINLEGRALLLLAFHHDASAILLDDSIDGGEAQSRTFAFFFRREKRFEEM